MLVVEDVHWIDRTSEEFLATLVDRLGGAPVLFVATHRPGYRVTWLDRSYGTQITLSPLAPADSARLVEAVAREQLGADVSQAILRRGEGNPFFLEELARTMIEHNAATDTIPQTVQGVIMARIDRLADVPKRLLQTASVIGREVPLGLLGRIWSGPADVDAALVELCRLEFFHERPAGDEPAYVFKHALTQDVAYDSLLTRTRGELHVRAAKALEAIHADRLDEIAATLAYHYARTDLLSEAVTWLTRAADGAARVYANAEALLHLDLAARRLQRLPEGPERDRRMIDVALRQAHSLYFLGRFRDSVDVLAPHEARLARLDDAALTAAYSFWLAHMYTRLGDPGRAGDSAQRAIAAATTSGDEATVGKAYGVLATQSYWAGRPQEAITHGMRSIQLLENRREHRWWLGMSHFYLAFSHRLLGDFDAALADAARADAVGREIDDPRLQTYAGYTAAWVEASRGNHDVAVARGRRSLELAPDRVSRAYASLFLGYALLEQGHHEQAQDALRPIVPELKEFPIPYWLALAETWTAETLRLQGRLDEAAGFVERGIQSATRVGYAYAMGFAHRIAGRIARDRGLVLEASSQLRQALEIFERASAAFEAARTRLDLAEVAAERGDRTEARDELTVAARTFQSLGATAYGDRTTTLAASLGLSVET